MSGLYGPVGNALLPRLDDLVAQHAARRSSTTRAPSESAAWLIAYPDQFSDGDRPTLKVLRQFIESWLEPMITGVHVLPIHPSSSDGGFSVVDYSRLASEYGDWTDFAALSSHLDVMADAVVNHLSASSTWFEEFLSGRSDRRDWFKTIGPDVDLSIVVRPRSTPLSTRFQRSDGSEVDVWTTFGPDQVDLDYTNPEVLLGEFDAVFEYVSQGGAAVRLDAVAYLWKQDATSSIHLPQTHAVIALLKDCLSEIDPDVMLVTETNVEQADNIAYFGSDADPEADAVYQFALPPLVLHAVLTGDTAPLTKWAAALEAPREGSIFLNFLATHDGVGLRPASGHLRSTQVDRLCEACVDAGGVVNHADTIGGGREPYELASTWFDLCAVGVSEDAAISRHLATHAAALALQGIPLVYSHSLLGSSNDWVTFESTGQGRDLNRVRLELADVERGLGDPASREAMVLAGMKRLLGFRRHTDAFHPSSRQVVHDLGVGIFAVERISDAGRSALVVVNFAGGDTTFELPPGRWLYPPSASAAQGSSGTSASGLVTLAPWSTLLLGSIDPLRSS